MKHNPKPGKCPHRGKMLTLKTSGECPICEAYGTYSDKTKYNEREGKYT